MNLHPVAARLMAAMLLGTATAGVVAAEKAPEKTKMPQTVPATTPPGTVTLDKMDDATQKTLGRGGASTAPAHPATASGSTDVRNWASIDTNQDQSISPAEMEAFLVVAHDKAAGK